MHDPIGDQWWLFMLYLSINNDCRCYWWALRGDKSHPDRVEPLLSVQPIGKYHNHSVAFIYQSCHTPCHVLPAAVSTPVRRSIHRHAVPSHRRPLPPCAAAPALNGESPSGGEAETLKDYRERRKGAKHLKQLWIWILWSEKGEGMKACNDCWLVDIDTCWVFGIKAKFTSTIRNRRDGVWAAERTGKMGFW